MSIFEISAAEKLTQIAENEQKVYEAGQSSMVDESKLIPKTVSGSYISVDDVSEIPHSVGCKVESANLIDVDKLNIGYEIGVSAGDDMAVNSNWYTTDKIAVLPNTTYSLSGTSSRVRVEYDKNGSKISIYGSTAAEWTFTTGNDVYFVRFNSIIKGYSTPMLNEGTTALPYTPYVKLEEVTVTRIGKNLATAQQVFKGFGSYGETVLDGRNAIRYLTNVSAKNTLPILEANTQYTISFDGKTTLRGTDNATSPFLYVYYTDGTRSIFGSTVGATDWTHYEFVTTAGKSVSAIGVEPYTYKIWHWVDVDTFQIEKGATATTYEPYNGQTLTPATDGIVEGMTSVSPYMNIFADTEGVNIKADYNKSYGMQTEYDRFWDAYQWNGTRPYYNYAFSYGWKDENYNPKYPFGKTLQVSAMFYYSTITDTKIEIDITKATSVQMMFESTTKLHTIRKLIVAENTVINANNFRNAVALENITFEGVIGCSINFQWCPLTKASITNIINTLSTAATGQTLTLKLSAVNTAFETSAGAADGSTSAEFAALVATKTNWTITMI